MCDFCKKHATAINSFPLTTKGEQEEISIHSAAQEEIIFRRVGLKIEIQLNQEKILVSPAALLCAARVFAGEKTGN